MKYPRLSPEDEKAFLDALDAIWNAVGYDCLDATGYSMGKKEHTTQSGWRMSRADQVTLRRSQVVDIVTDQFAGGMQPESYGPRGKRMDRDQYARILEWMRTTPAYIVDKVVKKRFTFARYGN